MQVQDLLKEKGNEVYTVREDAAIQDAVQQFNLRRVGALMVLDAAGAVVGIVSERDVLQQLDAACTNEAVKQIMTPKDRLVITHEDESLENVMAKFTQHRVRHLPVYREKEVVGLVSIGDVVKALLAGERYVKENLLQSLKGNAE